MAIGMPGKLTMFSEGQGKLIKRELELEFKGIK